MLKHFLEWIYWWLSARLGYLRYVNNETTTVLHSQHYAILTYWGLNSFQNKTFNCTLRKHTYLKIITIVSIHKEIKILVQQKPGFLMSGLG